MSNELNVRVATPITPKSSNTSLRLVSFNINGIKTLGEYHPWNELKNYSNMFKFMHADIISFQELKLQRSDVDLKLADIEGFQTFITVPQKKKGYSGVGVFIRKHKYGKASDIPDVDKSWLDVIKVEEGITGWLDVRGKVSSYRKIWDKFNVLSSEDKLNDECLSIGGYPDVNKVDGLDLDSEGRSIIIEMRSGLILISVYCPANSMLSEEGENRRCLFLECLFQRAENLKAMGKEVIIMGDINISPGLLDNDEYLRVGIQEKILEKCNENMELKNTEQAKAFRVSTPGRKIFNSYVHDTSNLTNNKGKFLFDLGREMNPLRVNMYTCWNTLKNYRPMNMGSRIDLFLATESIKDVVIECDIWRYLYGSDHCPIYCDFETDNDSLKNLVPSKVNQMVKHFDAKLFYGLSVSKGIDMFFKCKPAKNTNNKNGIDNKVSIVPQKRSATDSSYISRKKQVAKGQASLSSFFDKGKRNKVEPEVSLFVQDSEEEEEEEEKEEKNIEEDSDCQNNSIKQDISSQSKSSSKLLASTFTALLQTNSSGAPLCKHGAQSILRTTNKGENSGRKFWCCSKPRQTESWDSDKSIIDTAEFSCGFFKWASK